MKAFRSTLMLISLIAATPAWSQSILEGKTLETYQAQSAEQKKEELWSLITSSEYSLNFIHQALGTVSPELRKKLEDPEYLKVSFTHASDELPEGRVRLIHANGTVAKIRLERTEESKFTGLFQSGATGLVRLSLAAPQVGVIAGRLPLVPSIPFIPGMGLKLLIDGKESVNLMTMNSLDGQNNSRFFAESFTNDLPQPEVREETKKMFEAFQQAVTELKPGSSPLYLTLAPWARVSRDGSVVEKPLAPHAILMVPTKEACQAYCGWANVLTVDFRGRLENLEVGTTIYEIYTVEVKGSTPVHWGKLVMESEFVASSYGDRGLFFRHHLE